MLLGVPCVAADVGGVSNMMRSGTEGYVYQSSAPYMLAHYIREEFEGEAQGQIMGSLARDHARKTHDPETNLRDLLMIYREVAK
jgi:glycosyltransferase involved in cell wall biosynthesis